jgi:carbamoyl-phosphate synthase small subunit
MTKPPTACLALADGTIFYGHGFGATGTRVAELCFNTAMTGYQEIMTDPSYAGQIVTFTFPHIGNVGVNPEDDETGDPVAEGMVVKWDPTEPSNWRATGDLVSWLERTGRVGIGGLDTRRLTRAIRQQGAPHVALAHDPEGKFDLEALVAAARGFAGLEGVDLAKDVSCTQSYRWDEMRWAWPEGYARRPDGPAPKVVALDYGAKRNILRCLASAGCDVTVMPATTTAEDVMAQKPDGVFLSNGPGDPAATGDYAVPMIQGILADRPARLRHLSRPPDAGAGAGGEDGQDEPRPSRRQPSRQGSGDRQGRDHVDEPRLHRRQPDPARGRGRDPCQPFRWIELRHPHDRPPGLFGAVPPGGEPRAAGQFLPVRTLHRGGPRTNHGKRLKNRHFPRLTPC